MKARPILMSAPMVRALLDGRKTQTRRAVKPMRSQNFLTPALLSTSPSAKMHETWAAFEHPQSGPLTSIQCPYGVPGDLLWVREAFKIVPETAYRMSEGVQQTVNPSDRYYAAIYAAGWDRSTPKWKPSLFMPRWASRLTLEITEIRVERLIECSADDAFAEGIRFTLERNQAGGGRSGWGIEGVIQGNGLVHAYSLLWDSINGPGSWDANPWVWALTFKVHKANVHSVVGAAA